MLLTATPATNSPLEFYNLIEYIDPNAFGSAGIHDPEQFIDTFLRIEKRDVLDSTLEIAQKPAVVGFKNLDDLRTIILTYGEFRTAEDVGLRLPEAVVERVTVQMDEEQERTYDSYVARIEELLAKHTEDSDGRSMMILGLLQRLSLVALHPSLEHGYDFKSALSGGTSRQQISEDSLAYFEGIGWSKVGAGDEDGTVVIQRTLPAVDPSSPKFEAIARKIGANPQCGHIVFCEPTAAHAWLREVLVQHGIPRERIAILNAEVTKPADRTRIAKEFNGLSSEPLPAGSCAAGRDARVTPKYDVVIANSVAYEGIDLQTRTCSIHHADLPWTPAALQQRNGRGVRQGNDSPGDPRADEGTGIRAGVVKIFYYFADRSTDGYRFSLIDGKASWMADLLKSQVRDTNNPAAQQQLSPEDILLMISRNKDKTRQLLAQRAERAKAEARTKIVIEASRLLRQASGRFRDAREEADAQRAERLREEGEERLAALEGLDPEAWPWAPWMYVVRDTEVLPDAYNGAPLYEGLRLALPSGFVELGRILAGSEGPVLGVRQAGATRWDLRRPAQLDPMLPDYFPGEHQPAWPEDDDESAIEDLVSRVDVMFRYGSASIDDLAWRGASDAWVARVWPRIGERVVGGLARAYNSQPIPVLLGGRLARLDLAGKSAALNAGARALPPTVAGWRDFLALAPSSELSFTQLREAGNYWWDRKIPQTLLSAARAEPEAGRKGLQAVPPPPPPRPAAGLPAVPPPPARSETVSPAVVTLTRAQQNEAARRELDALALRPDRRAYWLGKVSSAIRVGDDWHALLNKAAAEADAGTSGVRGFLDSFNRGGTYSVELVREGATGKTYVVSRAFDGRPLATIATEHPLGGGGEDEEIANILWREPLSPQQQAEVTERFLDTLLYTDIGTLAAEAADMERRARALGADPARARGPLAEIAGVLAEEETVEALQDIRPLLYWTAAMISAPRCMGEVQDSSAAAVREAFRLYQLARRRLLAGAPTRAIVGSLARVVRAAAKLAGDCGEGQVTLLGVPLQLQVAPVDRANIEGGP